MKQRKQTPAIVRYVVRASVLVTFVPLFVAAVLGIHAMDSLWRTIAPKMSQPLIILYALAALITFIYFVRQGIDATRERKRHGYQPRKYNPKKERHDSPASGRAGMGSPFTFGGGDGGGGFGGGGASGSW